METRRQFVRGLSTNLAAAAFLTSELRIIRQSPRKIRIGIIGAENSHTIEYGRIFNRDKSFPGCEVVAVWGETEAFAQKAARDGQIPKIVKDPAELVGGIDALIVDHRHPKYHLAAASPFVAAGIPTFIDKPFCYRVDEGRKFLELARSKRTPVSSFSTLDEVISAANAAPYSFAAYLFTNRLDVRDEVVRRLNASNIGVNQLAPSLPDVPLGGLGNSGYGYEGGVEGILAFTQLRLISETAGEPHARR